MGEFDLERLKSHDEQAWASFAHFFEGRLYHFARRYSSRIDEEMAGDIVQETILTVYEEICVKSGELRERGKYLTTWVYAICKNRCRDTLRSLRTAEEKSQIFERDQAATANALPAEPEQLRQRPDMEACLDCLPEEELRKLTLDCLCPFPWDILDALVECLNRSKPKLRAVLLLRYIVGLKYKEISAALDITLEAVKGRLHEGTPELRQRLRQRGERAVPI